MYIFQPDRELLHQQIKSLGHHITGKTLDIGAGNVKRYSHFFNSTDYITLDPNPDNQPDVIATAEKLPFEDTQFDSIVCTAVLGDIFNLQTALQEFNRVLKPGGKILIADHLMLVLHDEPYDYWRFTPYSLKKIFKQNNFKKIEFFRRGGYHTMLMQLKLRHFILKNNLYQKKWARIINKPLKLIFKINQILDKLDNPSVNSKYAIGWTAIFEKI